MAVHILGAKYGIGVKQYVRSCVTRIRNAWAFLDGGPVLGECKYLKHGVDALATRDVHTWVWLHECSKVLLWRCESWGKKRQPRLRATKVAKTVVQVIKEVMSTFELRKLEFYGSSLRLQGGSYVLDGVSLRRQAGGCQEDSPRWC